MTNLPQARLVDHIDAAMAALPPATVARLADPDARKRKSAIAIMAQTLASRLAADRDTAAAGDTAGLPLLPIDPP